jgi:hypothetical protein
MDLQASTMQNNGIKHDLSIDFPAGELANFDLSHFDTSGLLFDDQEQHKQQSSAVNNSMDVDQDVASWLDSLCATNTVINTSNSFTTSTTVSSADNNSRKQQFNSLLLNSDDCELNGNSHNDLMPRGDPLMASTFNNESLSNDSDFDL